MVKRQVRLPLWGLNPVPDGRQAEVRIDPADATRCAWIRGRGAFDGARLYRWASADALVGEIRAARERHTLLGGDPIPYAVDPAVRARAAH